MSESDNPKSTQDARKPAAEPTKTRRPGARPASRAGADPYPWIFFGLASVATLLAIVVGAIPLISRVSDSPLSQTLERAGATPGLLLTIAAVALVGGLALMRLRSAERSVANVAAAHRSLLERSEALCESLDDVRRQTDISRLDHVAAQLGQNRAEIATLRSEIETRVLPAPELRRAFEEQGGKFADLGKFLHRLRTEWMDEMRSSIQPLAQRADLATLQGDVRTLLTDIASRITTLEADLARSESHFGSIESYLGSVSERLEESVRDVHALLNEEHKLRPADFRTGLTDLAEESRLIREAIRQVEACVHALQSQPASIPSPAPLRSPVEATPQSACTGTAVATDPNGSVFTAIEKLRQMMGGA